MRRDLRKKLPNLRPLMRMPSLRASNLKNKLRRRHLSQRSPRKRR